MKCRYPVIYERDGELCSRPCGKCVNCLINYREEWAVRLVHEMSYWDSASFVTLTYSDRICEKKGYVPYSLNYTHLSNFWHYLREDLRSQGRECKYFACGEYGDGSRAFDGVARMRPHFHAIVFGLDPFNEQDRKLVVDNWRWCEEFMFRPKFKNGAWSRGQGIDFATPDNMNYTCGYIQKKLYGKESDELYKNALRNPPKGFCSQGIGKRYAIEHKEQILQLMRVQRKGHYLPIPRQYYKWYGLDNAVLRGPYYADYVSRHPESGLPHGELYDYESIYDKVSKEVELSLGPLVRNMNSKREYTVWNHLFQSKLSIEIQRQADLYLVSERRFKAV